MFVVNTTSATVGGTSERSWPRKRVPSSRRRNPGVKLGRDTRLWRLRRSRSLRVTAARSGRDGQHVRIRLCRRGRWRRGLRREGLVQNRPRRGAARTGERQHEGDRQKNSTAPPADLRQEVSCLTSAEDGVSGARDAAEARGESTTLARLQQNGGDQNHAVDDQQRDKKGRKHQIQAGPASGRRTKGERARRSTRCAQLNRKHVISRDLRRRVKWTRWRSSSRLRDSRLRREGHRL